MQKRARGTYEAVVCSASASVNVWTGVTVAKTNSGENIWDIWVVKSSFHGAGLGGARSVVFDMFLDLEWIISEGDD